MAPQSRCWRIPNEKDVSLVAGYHSGGSGGDAGPGVWKTRRPLYFVASAAGCYLGRRRPAPSPYDADDNPGTEELQTLDTTREGRMRLGGGGEGEEGSVGRRGWCWS